MHSRRQPPEKGEKEKKEKSFQEMKRSHCCYVGREGDARGVKLAPDGSDSVERAGVEA